MIQNFFLLPIVPLKPRSIPDAPCFEDEFSRETSVSTKIQSNCTKEFNIVAVDYDPVESYIYWTDQSFGINRVTRDGLNEEQLIVADGSVLDGIAIGKATF